MRNLSLLLTALALSGCQTWGPTWSEITGERFNTTIEHRRPAIIERVGDQGSFPSKPIKVQPGMQRVVISAPTPGWSGGSPLEVINLDMKPCMRYYVNAQFRNPVDREFTPVVDFVETIAGCKVPDATK